jgi:hypothetical protein
MLLRGAEGDQTMHLYLGASILLFQTFFLPNVQTHRHMSDMCSDGRDF